MSRSRRERSKLGILTKSVRSRPAWPLSSTSGWPTPEEDGAAILLCLADTPSLLLLHKEVWLHAEGVGVVPITLMAGGGAKGEGRRASRICGWKTLDAPHLASLARNRGQEVADCASLSMHTALARTVELLCERAVDCKALGSFTVIVDAPHAAQPRRHNERVMDSGSGCRAVAQRP